MTSSSKSRKKVLLCGATGFIGRNLLDHFLKKEEFEITGTYHRTLPPTSLRNDGRVTFLRVDLTDKAQVDRAVQGKDLVIQAAATTSGAREILSKPYHHVTDNAVMNSWIFRSCHENQVGHLVFFSCSIFYPSQAGKPVRECDFDYKISDPYFGAGWTKVYLEKMCEFYSKLGPTRFTVIRHSNIYGPFDKVDAERSHVFGATVAKVMAAPDNGKVTVWGEGLEERDLLHVDDLTAFVDKAAASQECRFELINVGSGESIAVRDLVAKIIKHSGKNLKIEFDRKKPSIPFSLKLNIDRARSLYGWAPKITLEEGIVKTLDWYRSQVLERQAVA